MSMTVTLPRRPAPPFVLNLCRTGRCFESAVDQRHLGFISWLVTVECVCIVVEFAHSGRLCRSTVIACNTIQIGQFASVKPRRLVRCTGAFPSFSSSDQDCS